LEQNSVVRVSQIPAFTGGPNLSDKPLQVLLIFPDGELSNQQYAVHRGGPSAPVVIDESRLCRW
jgi:hypothetical protein